MPSTYVLKSQPAGGWFVSEGGVVSFIIVGVKPGGRGCLAFGGGVGEGMLVSPLGLEGVVEAFDFPVLPGTVWLDEYLSRSRFFDHGCEAVSVSPGVISHDLFGSRNPRRGKETLLHGIRTPRRRCLSGQGAFLECANRQCGH